jgi:hypothetical protein
MSSIKEARAKAAFTLTAAIARAHPDLSAARIGAAIYDLQRAAVSLHRRYEAACSYQWANTDAYERRTEKLETFAAKRAQGVVGLTVEHQRDPRGWPIIVKLDGVEIGRLG